MHATTAATGRFFAALAGAAVLGSAATAQVIAYDEFDGRCRGGWKEAGLGEWRTVGRERDGAFVATHGNDWRALHHPVEGVVWYALTLRLAAPIEGYVSVVPADSAHGQFTELGFNSAYGTRSPLWTGSGIVRAEELRDGTTTLTLLQRYDFAADRWSGWGATGDGKALLATADGTEPGSARAAVDGGFDEIAAPPLVRDARCAWNGLGWIYLSKGSAVELSIERIGIARTAREALTPIDDPATPIEGVEAATVAAAAAAAAAEATERATAVAAGRDPARIATAARSDLAGSSSPLRADDVVSFFGDSLTWQGGYVDVLAQALGEAPESAPARRVKLVKRGINGGKSTDLRAGCKELYGCTQPPLAACLAEDRSSVVVIVIGINDVWHGKDGNPPAVYASTLEELVSAAQAGGAVVVVGTPPLIGEKPRGSNPFDAPLDEYAKIALQVAAKCGAVGVPLRDLAFAELARRNPAGAAHGVLTYDGVHLTELGNQWMAEELAAGIARALRFAREFAIVPWPKEVQLPPPGTVGETTGRRAPTRRDPGRRSVGQVAVAADDARLHAVAGALNEPLRRALGIEGRGLGAAARGDVTRVALALDPALAEEEYRLEIDADGSSAGDAVDVAAVDVVAAEPPAAIRVVGGSPRAVAWAGATLVQLCEPLAVPRIGDPVDGGGDAAEFAVPSIAGVLPAITIRDRPDAGWRGLLVDVARQPHRIETLRQLVVLCWLAKVPWLQLHLTDDQAFTFPSRTFPELATVGHAFTRSELTELVAFAEPLGVTILPELDLPGHCGALIKARPELFQAHRLHHATIDFARPEVVAAMKQLVDELIELFPTSPWIHLGGDECDLEHVDENPHWQRAYARNGVADKHGLYLWFLGEMDRHVKSRGKRTIVWEGFPHGAEPALPRDVTVMAYEALYHLPGCLVADGYPVINASWKPLYVVNDRCWEPTEIQAWNRFQWDHFVEGFPAFGGLAIPPSERVLGGHLCAWEQQDERELPSLRRRLPALSEALWNETARRSPADFLWRLDRLDAKLAALLR